MAINKQWLPPELEHLRLDDAVMQALVAFAKCLSTELVREAIGPDNFVKFAETWTKSTVEEWSKVG